MNIFFILSLIALLATLGILFAGILGMGKGEIEGAHKSNKLMRARIISQGLVVVFMLLWLATSQG